MSLFLSLYPLLRHRMPEALARQAPHPLKTVVTVLSGAVCIPGRCTPARRCLAPGTRAATLTAFHAHVTPFPALGEHCCWDRDVHRNLTDAPPPTTVLPPSFPGLNPPPPSRLLSTIPPPSLPFPRSSPQRLRALAGFAPSKLHCARPLCVSCGRAPWACVCARREASGAVWYMSVCAAVSLGGYEKNKTLIAIATQHAETYGDNRSPIRAAFQNSPNTLVASVCVCVCVCARAFVTLLPQRHGTYRARRVRCRRARVTQGLHCSQGPFGHPGAQRSC